MLLVALALSLSGTPDPATDEAVRAYLGQDEYAIAPLALRTDLPEAWDLALPLAGTTRTVALEKRSLRAPHFQLLLDPGNGELEAVEPPPVSTYRGTIAGWPTAVVSLTLTANGAKGLVWDAGTAWSIEPLVDVVDGAAAGQHLIVPLLRSPFEDAYCGVPHAAGDHEAGPGTGHGSDGSPTCLTIADLSYDCDFECYQQFGSDAAATLLDIEAVTDGMTVPFEAEVFITYRLGTVIVRTAEPDPYTSTDSGVMLSEFQTEWNTNQVGVVRDVVHLATGKELDSNIIGLAYVGTVCPNGAEYGLTQWNISFQSRINVVAHELGHNWSAPHCLDATYCGIMCGICTLSFGPITRDQIIGFRDTRGCVEPPTPVVTGLFPNDTVEVLTVGTDELVGITGDCFTDDSFVSVDGVSLDVLDETYTVQNDFFISFEMPLVSTLGDVEVRVDDADGGGAATLTVVPNAETTHQAGDGAEPALLYTATGAPFVLAGQPGELHLLVYSTSNVPSISPLVSLDLGNNFTDVNLAGLYTIGNAGWTPVTLPVSGVMFATFYSQTVRITGGAPYADSNLQEVFVVF